MYSECINELKCPQNIKTIICRYFENRNFPIFNTWYQKYNIEDNCIFGMNIDDFRNGGPYISYDDLLKIKIDISYRELISLLIDRCQIMSNHNLLKIIVEYYCD